MLFKPQVWGLEGTRCLGDAYDFMVFTTSVPRRVTRPHGHPRVSSHELRQHMLEPPEFKILF